MLKNSQGFSLNPLFFKFQVELSK